MWLPQNVSRIKLLRHDAYTDSYLISERIYVQMQAALENEGCGPHTHTHTLPLSLYYNCDIALKLFGV